MFKPDHLGSVWHTRMEGADMAIILAVLLVAVLFAGFGFALHVLWWIALILLVLWLLGFVLRGPQRSRRWYRW